MPRLDPIEELRITDLAVTDAGRVLTPEALALLSEVHREFDEPRRTLLARRPARRERIAKSPGWLSETADIRAKDWVVASIPAPLQDRRVEITGPVDRKMMINALNSGAKVFMADFEDSHSPVWSKTIAGQGNIMDAVRGDLRLSTGDKHYAVGPDPALLVVRVRGLHLDEPHAVVDGQPVSAGFFDAVMTLTHNAREQLARGTGPYLYIPKLEGHEEARLWASVLDHVERALELPHGSIKVTVLIETLPAAFEMEEILWELRDHIVALNAGRWDYIFSYIKVFAEDDAHALPDRAQVTMSAPFMQAYAKRLVDVCHRRGALAMGGMSAFIPNRRDHAVTDAALAAVRADKEREVADGFDGTWVAHPDLVPVAMAIFDEAFGTRANQIHRHEPSHVKPADLLTPDIAGAQVTQAGVETNIEVALRYLTAWLTGTGAVAIHDLMEDAATAEISRCQLWHWRYHSVKTADGGRVDASIIKAGIRKHVAALRAEAPDAPIDAAAALLEKAVLVWPLPDFITVLAAQTHAELTS